MAARMSQFLCQNVRTLTNVKHLAAAAAPAGYPWTEAPTTVPESHFLPQPYFEQTPSSVMVRPGQTVQIPCRVRNLGDKIIIKRVKKLNTFA
ncbi:hypothetical protein J6590_082539 [Homalodisca vitripennis]|nr:hypothetical protein J6590_082539 [Homalodisca vitripennis]